MRVFQSEQLARMRITLQVPDHPPYCDVCDRENLRTDAIAIAFDTGGPMMTELVCETHLAERRDAAPTYFLWLEQLIQSAIDVRSEMRQKPWLRYQDFMSIAALELILSIREPTSPLGRKPMLRVPPHVSAADQREAVSAYIEERPGEDPKVRPIRPRKPRLVKPDE